MNIWVRSIFWVSVLACIITGGVLVANGDNQTVGIVLLVLGLLLMLVDTFITYRAKNKGSFSVSVLNFGSEGGIGSQQSTWS